ncbi:MAG TPA: hypothetical protein PKD53_01495 [Chloroflexaceae bacterium]|nr:hypothetical protein [Chloroflexaceae bacterium]
MAMDLLQQFFGDGGRQDDYDDFVRRFESSPEEISDEEASRRYREMLHNAPPELVEEANEHALTHLNTDQRRALARRFREANDDPGTSFHGFSFRDEDEAAQPRNLGRMMKQADEQDQGLLEQILGVGQSRSMGGGQGGDPGSLLSTPLGKAALAAGAAFLANRFLSGRGRGAPGGLGSMRKGGGGGGIF